MAKSFKKSNPLDNIDNQTQIEPVAAVDNQPTEMASEFSPEEPKKKSKGKVGRPKTKTEDTKTINIAVPVSTLDRINDIKACFNNNLTQYINKLIEKDLDSNYDSYKQIADSLNNFK